jgi:hypothetical protein
MIKIIIITLLAFILLTNCRLTDKNENRPVNSDMISPDPENAPIMTFESEIYEFEDMAIGSTIKHSFKFENTGKSALLLFDVKASCGCTVLKGWPKEPVAPGETAEIPFEFTPNVTGKNEKTVSIVANTIPSTKKLSIKGMVVGQN